MQDSQGLLLVLGMAVVTYLPRLLPMLLLSTDKLPSFLKRFFDFVPYAVLTTLIFPEILFFHRSARFGYCWWTHCFWSRLLRTEPFFCSCRGDWRGFPLGIALLKEAEAIERRIINGSFS